MEGVTDIKHLSCAQQLLRDHQTRLKAVRFPFLLAGGEIPHLKNTEDGSDVMTSF